ncbi:helix-turn-helix domain-containing protein [Microbulbifer taiwanensis]|uniref:Helix-turn-helix domain-containing protein n=1 Tax=Microbulbifer taiwanensis TaxID=986746 RepID=A0ABW1YQ44_9GAMM|nr:helix-turn-helix transcriptional regulator [Microbulbifer taiwanensis]
MEKENPSVGDLVRQWRLRRRLSQLAFACEADISAKHLCFVETGRARPSRDMLLHLCEHLGVPIRERNRFLVAAGYAPAYPERPLDDAALAAARQAVEKVLAGHEPYPALAVDRHWNLVSANRALQSLLVGVAPELLQPPVNVLRLSLHPRGLAPKIENLPQWRTHLLSRLRQQRDASADPVLSELLRELLELPQPDSAEPPDLETDIVVPLRLASDSGPLSLISTTTVFGTPVDVTLSELAIEAFFPADTATANLLHSLRKVDSTATPT